jgi:sterol desaturase/sphingolipid hydroxylase (fatty acid hydroxylase superfamily)
MEEYGKILLIAMPFFLVLIILERTYGYFKEINHTPLMDSVSSISSGMTNAVKDALGLSIVIISYEWMATNFAVLHVESTVITYVIAFVTIDFYGYWSHRWAHQINIFWNKHAIHHSSEEFNLACALRQPISSFVNLFTFLLLPAAILGIPSTVIAILLPLHLFLQFWYHTRYIGKLGILESIIVTPSHHRVHHAINPEYMDKNHGQIFIFWDKWFGTFQEELETVPPVFGITRPAHTWNPIRINFQHLGLLIKDAYRSKNWIDKLTIWFKPTGWRPKDFDEKYPIEKINDVYHFQKYGHQHSTLLKYWSVIQLFMTLGLISYLFGNIATIGLPNCFIYGLFIFLTIYSYTELMDTRKFAVFWESLRFVFSLGIIYYFGDWFGLSKVIPKSNELLISYFSVSLAISLYFVLVEFQNHKKPRSNEY